SPPALATHTPPGTQNQGKRPVGGSKSSGRTKADLVVAEGRIPVRAPMVGSFYRRPSPQDKPFVEVGQRVNKGDPLCLIEVMKLYTTIEAPTEGVIEAIPTDDGSAVEFDQL